MAFAYYKKGDFPQATDEFSSLHGAEPGNVGIATLLANCYLRQGRNGQVLSLLTPFEKANPDDLDLEWAPGSALIRAGRALEGLKRVEKVALQGPSGEAYMLAAQAYLVFRAFDQGIRPVNPPSAVEVPA